jgi:serine protease Do
MSQTNQRVISLAAVVVAAILFGMVLSGGLGVTTRVNADRPADEAQPTPAAVNFLAPDFAALADRVIPSVVSVTVTEYRQRSSSRMPRDFFHRFFDPREEEGESEPQPRARRSEGSGFFISADGEILTNNHVVEDADKIEVVLENGDSLPAELVGADPTTDLALLRVTNGDDFPFLPLGSAENLRVGEWVMAAGNPMDMDHTITVGVVSGKGRVLGLSNRSFENYIQTDAAINFGNSGGPLVNLSGQVVGINTAINARGQNLGFAVPVEIATSILDQLRTRGKVVRGYLGVTIDNIDASFQEAWGLDSRDGAFVQSVEEDSPAEKAGLEPSDVIVSVDGRAVDTTRTLIDTIASKAPGTKIHLDVIRNGERLDLVVTLGERPDAATEAGASDSPEESEDQTAERVGITVRSLDAETRRMYGVGRGVSGVIVTQVRPDSPAGEEGLARGDVILQANGDDVTLPSELLERVEQVDDGGYLRLYVFRPQAEQRFFVVLKLGDR